MNSVLADLPTTVFETMSRLARQHEAVNLGQGFPEDPGPLDKPNWTPAEYDRLRAAALGWRHHPDGRPMMVPGPHGPVQARRSQPENRDAWSFMIPFLAYSVSRNGQIHLTRWVPGSVEPRGRGFERGEERPWIEVLPDCIVFHRDGNERYDGTKRHGWNFIPKEFEPEVRARHARDMAAGIEWVFHKPDGERYGERLPSYTVRQIVADAGLPEGTTPHSLKDLAVAWAIASAHRDIPMPTTVVAIGEVGLAGDLRRVTGMERRLAEAARLGFTCAVVPPGVKDAPAGLRVVPADDISGALRVLRTIADNGSRHEEG